MTHPTYRIVIVIMMVLVPIMSIAEFNAVIHSEWKLVNVSGLEIRTYNDADGIVGLGEFVVEIKMTTN